MNGSLDSSSNSCSPWAKFWALGVDFVLCQGSSPNLNASTPMGKAIFATTGTMADYCGV
jgi:hypothetical protein